MRRPSTPFLLLVAILLQAATSIRVERVVVPSVVLAGRRVVLECQYREEGDKLYSLKWWRGDDQFYQYVPPTRAHFPVSGVVVNWTATSTLNSGHNGQEIVVLEGVGLDTAGVYKCEVMADTSFQTEFREANMTVVYEPEDPPILQAAQGTNLHNMSLGQRVALRCTSSPASPPPMLSWFINNRRVDPSWVQTSPPVFQRHLARVSSRLTFPFTAPYVTPDRALKVTCVATMGRVPSPSSRNASSRILSGGSGGAASYYYHHQHNHNTFQGYQKNASLLLKPLSPPSFWERMFSGSRPQTCCGHYHSLLLLFLLLLGPLLNC